MKHLTVVPLLASLLACDAPDHESSTAAVAPRPSEFRAADQGLASARHVEAYYGVIITDPAGYELGGEFTGFTAPAGSALAYGRYQIETHTGESIPIAFQSASPFTFDVFGNMSFRCELFSDELGSGEGSGIWHGTQEANGEFRVDLRNVLTFR